MAVTTNNKITMPSFIESGKCEPKPDLQETVDPITLQLTTFWSGSSSGSSSGAATLSPLCRLSTLTVLRFFLSLCCRENMEKELLLSWSCRFMEEMLRGIGERLTGISVRDWVRDRLRFLNKPLNFAIHSQKFKEYNDHRSKVCQRVYNHSQIDIKNDITIDDEMKLP